MERVKEEKLRKKEGKVYAMEEVSGDMNGRKGRRCWLRATV